MTTTPFTPTLVNLDGTHLVWSGVQYKPAAGTTFLSLVTKEGNAIDYMERSHIYVWRSINDFETYDALVRPNDYDFDSTGTSIVLVVPSVAGEQYLIKRITPLSQYVEFADGATLTAEQLNRLARVNRFRDQEQAEVISVAGGGGGGGGGGGTVTRVTGGAGMTGDVTVSGALNVGAGSGISVFADTVAVNRATVDTWYASTSHSHALATTTAPGFVPTRPTADPTTKFLRGDGTWDVPPAPAGGATNLDGLSDVTISGPLTNEVLLYDGTHWKNSLSGSSSSSIERRIDRNWSSNVSGVVASGAVRLNNTNWKSATQVVVDYTDSKTGENQGTIMGATPAGTRLRISWAAGTLDWNVVSVSLSATNTDATYTVSDPTGSSATPAGGAVTLTLSGGAQSAGVVELNQLNDVTLTAPANDQVLKYNSSTSQWINAAAPAGGATNLNGLTDVTITSPQTRDFLAYGGSGPGWENKAASALLVDTTSPGFAPTRPTTNATTKFLRGDGTWDVPTGTGGGATNLDGLTDVTISVPSANNYLWYDGSLWRNAPLSGVNLSYTAATRSINITAGSSAILPLFSTTAGLVPGTPSGTTNFLRADGTWAAPPAGGGGATNLDGLTDVTITSPLNAQILRYNGSQWVNSAGSGGTVVGVTGVAPISVTTSTTQPAVSITPATTSAAGSMSAADKLKLDGLSSVGGATNLDALTDVTIATPAATQVLRYDGSQWRNSAGVTVENVLTSTSTTNALSAAQGKVVNDKFASYLLKDLSLLPALP